MCRYCNQLIRDQRRRNRQPIGNLYCHHTVDTLHRHTNMGGLEGEIRREIPDRDTLLDRVRRPIHLTNDDPTECPICYDNMMMMMDPVSTSCSHIFCRTCILTLTNQNNSCPYCRAELYCRSRAPHYPTAPPYGYHDAPIRAGPVPHTRTPRYTPPQYGPPLRPARLTE